MISLGLALSGFGAGLLGAVLGIGGGVFLIPALVLAFSFPMPQAVATGLVAVIATSSAVASVNVERGWANMRLGMFLELATVAGALAAGLAAAAIPARALIGAFGLLLAAFAALLWKPPAASDPGPAAVLGPFDGRYFDPAAGREITYHFRRLPLGLAVSTAAGALSGLLGIGGGVLKVPVLNLYCGVPMKAAAATSNFMVGATAAASAFVYYGRGHVDPLAAGPVVLGVLAGSAAGARLSRRLADASVRRGFAALLVFLSVQMLRRALNG